MSALTRTIALGLIVAGCGAGDSADGASFFADAGPACASDDDCPNGSVCFDGECIFQGAPGDGEPAPGGPDQPPPAPPEMEVEITARISPAAGRTGVWVVAPDADRAVRIDGATLSVQVIEVGDEPSAVHVRAGTDAAVILCRGSDELMVLDPDGEPLTAWRLPGHFNALALGPEGRFAYAWFDLSVARPDEDAAAVQDVAVVDLDTGAMYPVVIGFGPRRVQFTVDGVALFVTDDGVSVIEPALLEGPRVAPTVPVAPDVFSQVRREVVLTSDGAFAASRGPGETGITIVALREGVPRAVPLGAEPTDLDLLPDGLTALVMMREAQRLALVPLDTAVDDPDSVRIIEFAGRPLGSATVSPTGDRAVLYATRLDAAPAAAILSLPEGQIIDIALRKRARAAAIDPAGGVAWVLHGTEPPGLPEPEVDADPDAGIAEDAAIVDAAVEDAGIEDAEVVDAEPVDMASEPAPTPSVDPALAERPGYSLVDLDTGFVKLQVTPADAEGLIFTADGAAFVAFPDPPSVQRIDLDRFDTRDWSLGSAPQTVGLMPAVDRAFVTQDHPSGRISFVPLDPDDDRVETLTGYALDGRIR